MKKIIIYTLLGLFCSNIYSQKGAGDISYIDTIDFENSYQYIITYADSNNLWDIAEPDKINFNSAYSGTNSILTDSINSYSINNHSFFDLKIGSFNYGYAFPYSFHLKFKHKFDTDTLKDGCFITISYDYGNSWTNIINDTIYRLEYYNGYSPLNDDNGFNWKKNLYSLTDTLFNGEFGYSGKTNDWDSTSIAWYVIPEKNINEYILDTIILRFNFISDSIYDNKDGWIIDDIILYVIDPGGSINNYKLKEELATVFPNPTDNEINILLDKSYKSVSLKIIDMTGKVLISDNYKNCIKIKISNTKLNQGIYFCSLLIEESFYDIEKIIIE